MNQTYRTLLTTFVAMLALAGGAAFAQAELFLVVQRGSPAAVADVIELGADLNARDAFGLTPLMVAASTNYDETVHITLIRAGADVNARTPEGWTALMYAARDNKNPEVITALLELGADPTLINDDGLTAQAYAGANSFMRVSGIFETLQRLDGQPSTP
ncbi:MAG: ankyrin repeat domain-containing protein [Trueperaceae bacterium]|nr:ankyrin repeat domain-containing protein [Trueperaceae bacterium]